MMHFTEVNTTGSQPVVSSEVWILAQTFGGTCVPLQKKPFIQVCYKYT